MISLQAKVLFSFWKRNEFEIIEQYSTCLPYLVVPLPTWSSGRAAAAYLAVWSCCYCLPGRAATVYLVIWSCCYCLPGRLVVLLLPIWSSCRAATMYLVICRAVPCLVVHDCGHSCKQNVRLLSSRLSNNQGKKKDFTDLGCFRENSSWRIFDPRKTL